LGVPEVGVVLIDIVTSLHGNVFVQFLHVLGLQGLVIFKIISFILLFLHSCLEFIGGRIHLSVPEIGVVIVSSLESDAVVEFILINSWMMIVIFNFLYLNFFHLGGELLSGLIHLGFPEVRVMLVNALLLSLDVVLGWQIGIDIS
jgi:hypothetical protein